MFKIKLDKINNFLKIHKKISELQNKFSLMFIMITFRA